MAWARHGSWFTRPFEDQCAWLAVNTSQSAVAQLMRTTWRAVGAICRRVADQARAQRDLLDGLRRIGFDEISVRKGQSYLTVVVDHHSDRLVWAAPGRDRQSVETFLDLLGDERCAQVELVSCDMAEWITRPIAERCPGATLCLDPFHIVKLATDALDEIRREVWNEARKAARSRWPRISRARGSRCGRTPRTSPHASSSSSRTSRRSTSACIAPTCSRSNCARSTASTPTRRSACWTRG